MSSESILETLTENEEDSKINFNKLKAIQVFISVIGWYFFMLYLLYTNGLFIK